MRTPSLSARILVGGVAVVFTLLTGLDALVYLRIRATLLDSLRHDVATQALLARVQGNLVDDPEVLAERLSQAGVSVSIRGADGTLYGASPAEARAEKAFRQEVPLPGGAIAVVFADRSEVDASLRWILLLAVVCTVLVTVLAAVLLRWISEVALRPLDQVVVAARRTAAGRRGERLHPDRPDTKLGRMATAYDDMLDSLEQAEERTSRLASIVESSDDAIIGMDLEGRVFSWNRAAERIHGYSAEEVLSEPLSNIVHPDHLDDLHRSLAQVRGGEPVPYYETVWLCRDGSTIDVGVTVSPVHRAGKVSGASVIARDLTGEHRLAERLRAALAELQVALQQAQESESRTRRFLDDAAHQLRTPIAGIQACAETLLRSPSLEERERLLAALVRETSRAGRLMGALLRMARLGHGERIAPKPFDLVALCDDEAEAVRAVSPALDVAVRPLGDIPDIIADANAVREIAANLLDNARRHASSRIDVSVAVPDEHFEVRVRNDGPGLPSAIRESVFERFVTLDGRGGTGLGLAIGRELARTLGGDLVYEDRAFVLRLPRHPPAAAPAEDLAESARR